MMSFTTVRTATSSGASGEPHPSGLAALARRIGSSVLAAAALTACGGTNVVAPLPRDMSVLVQLTCDFPTIHAFQLYWDDHLVDTDTYQSITVNLTSLSYDGTVLSGAHKIGVAISSQTASPNRCYIYGVVTATTGGAGDGPQAIVVPGESRSLATGVVSTFSVTIN
jgi:hypothetical protein